jgi:RHS repeat-associated protein
MLSETRYKAWGELRYSTGTTTTPYTYTGQYSNTADFGWMYYKARWFDPSLDRFSQADTIVLGAGDPRAWDRYAYVKNSPVVYNDPSGHGYCDEEGNCYLDYGDQIPNNNKAFPVKNIWYGPNMIRKNYWQGYQYAMSYKNVSGEHSPFDCANYVSNTWLKAGIPSTDKWFPGSPEFVGVPRFIEYWESRGVEIIKLSNTPDKLMVENNDLVEQLKALSVPNLSIVVYNDKNRHDFDYPEYGKWDHLGIIIGSNDSIPVIVEHDGPYSEKSGINERSMLDSPNKGIIDIWIIIYPGSY